MASAMTVEAYMVSTFLQKNHKAFKPLASTHHKQMEKEVDAANMALAATLSKRQQQMQALHEGPIELVGGEPKPEVTP